jgi:hypothetical protein
MTLLFVDDELDASPVEEGLTLLSDNWLDGKGKVNGIVLLLPLLDINFTIAITFEVVGFRSLFNEGDVHDKSRTILLLSVMIA